MKITFDYEHFQFNIIASDVELGHITHDIDAVLNTSLFSSHCAMYRAAFESLYFDLKYAIYRRIKNIRMPSDLPDAFCSLQVSLIEAGLLIRIREGLPAELPLSSLLEFIDGFYSFIRNSLSDGIMADLNSLYMPIEQKEESYFFIKLLSDTLLHQTPEWAIWTMIAADLEKNAASDPQQNLSQSQCCERIHAILTSINRRFPYSSYRAVADKLTYELESDLPCYDEIVGEINELYESPERQ